MNDAGFGKFGLQLSKNGASLTNLTLRSTPLSGSKMKLELSNASQPLKNVSVVVEFNTFDTFPDTVGLAAFTTNIFNSNTFQFLRDEKTNSLLGANKSTFKINKVTVTRNGNDYLSIRETIMNITDASEGNRYEVFVPSGNWFELDIQPKEWVKLILDPNAIVYCDSTVTDAKYVVPTNYPYPSQIGKQINTVNYDLLHTLWIKANTEIEGGAFRIKRGKYACHIDSNTFQKALFTGVAFESLEDCLHPVGIGIWGGQTLTFNKCTFKTYIQEFGVGQHNWNNQTLPSTGNYIDCKWDGCSYIKIDEIGSNQNDVINLINCTTNVKGAIRYSVSSADGTNSYWKDSNNATTNNPNNVPYNLVLNAKGTNIDEIKVGTTGWSAYPNQYTRDIAKLLDGAAIDGYVKCVANGSFNKGEVVAFNRISRAKITVSKYQGDTSGDIYGIAISSTSNGQNVWIGTKGKIVDTAATGVDFNNEASKKLTYTGGLVSNQSAKFYEVLAIATEISIGGLVRAKLK